MDRGDRFSGALGDTEYTLTLTAPLDLANDLAARDGVEIATPNWLIQRVLR